MGSESRFGTRRGSRKLIAYGACAIVAPLAAAIALQINNEPKEDADVSAQGLSYGYMSFEGDARSVATAPPPASQTSGLPSVPAMIGQLENRLDREPDDAKGWSLLAQSYAYIGNTSGTERAISNAVRFGLEESVIRSQIAIVSNERN